MIPDHIVVGGQVIATQRHNDRADISRADVNCWKNRINITTEEQSCEMQEQSYCHELIHLLIHKSGMNYYLNSKENNNEIEEQICCSLENIVWQFLKNNTNFFEFKEEK